MIVAKGLEHPFLIHMDFQLALPAGNRIRRFLLRCGTERCQQQPGRTSRHSPSHVLPPCLYHKENKFTVVTVLSPRRKTWSPCSSLFCDIKPFPLFILGGGLLRILNGRDHQLSYQTIGPFSRLSRWDGTP